MGLFNNFPYMDLSNLNLDFVLKKLKDLTNYAESAESSAASAESAKDLAILARDAADASAASAQSSARDAQLAENSAENYAAHIADPVSGLVTTWLDTNIGPTTPPVDSSLSIQGAAADAKATGDAIDTLTEALGEVSSIPTAVKLAMDTMFQKIAMADDDGYAGDYAVIHEWAASITVLSISAVYTQSGTVYSIDSLDSLRNDLVVTAHYSDGTSAPVTVYSLSGSLTAGTSIITVTYEGKTASFNVTVTAVSTLYTVTDHLFNGTAANTIDTGIKLHDTDKDYTVLIDFNAQTQGSSIYRLLSDVTNVTGGSSGLSIVKYDDSKSNFRWCNATVQFSDWNKNTTGNIKFAIRHTANSGACILKLKKGAGTIKTYTAESVFLANENNMILGTNRSGSDVLYGTGSFYFYGAVLDDAHVESFLNGD